MGISAKNTINKKNTLKIKIHKYKIKINNRLRIKSQKENKGNVILSTILYSLQ